MTVTAPPEPATATIRPSRGTVLVAATVALTAVAIAVGDRATVQDGVARLGSSDREWLLLAGTLACSMWLCGTLTQLGVVRIRPPIGRLFAVQVAGSFANHVLPAGVGGIAVNLRFLRRLGMTRQAALAAQALNASAGALTHLVLLAIALAFAPATLLAPATARLDTASDRTGTLLLAAGIVLTMGAVVAATTRRTLLTRTAAELRLLAAVAADPRRAVSLWTGAFAGPLVHAVVLFAVLRAIGSPLSLLVVLPVYLACSALSALVPSPGGIGSLDVVLTAGLATAGLPVGSAVGAVVAYRFLTVWLPLLPAAGTLAVLIKRRVL